MDISGSGSQSGPLQLSVYVLVRERREHTLKTCVPHANSLPCSAFDVKADMREQ